MIIGTFKAQADGNIEGNIDVAFGNVNLCFRANPAHDNGDGRIPAFHIFAKEEQGAAWWRETKERDGRKGVTILSASLDDPFLPTAINFALWPRRDAPGRYDAIWRRPAVASKHTFEGGTLAPSGTQAFTGGEK